MIIEFDSFKAYRENMNIEVPDLDWLRTKLSREDFEELNSQVLYHLLETEEDAFTRGMAMANAEKSNAEFHPAPRKTFEKVLSKL